MPCWTRRQSGAGRRSRRGGIAVSENHEQEWVEKLPEGPFD